MKNKILIIILSILCIYSCKQQVKVDNNLKEEIVTIKGKIHNYQNTYKTGRFTYFDAITRTIEHKIISIDSLGKFNFSFKLIHPLYNSVFFEIEDKNFTEFMIKPKTNYDVVIKEGKLIFEDKWEEINKQISTFNNELNEALKDKLPKFKNINIKELSTTEYLNYQKEMELEKSSFLTSYSKKNNLSKDVKSFLKSKLKYKSAHASINARFEYSQGFRKQKKILPKDFYKNIFNEYQVTTFEDIQSRECIDYISNIVAVLSNKDTTADNKFEFFKSFNFFSPTELDLLYKLFNDFKTVSKTTEYLKFLEKNRDMFVELNWRYYVHTLLKNIDLLSSGLTKDLVISQGLEKYYFSNNLRPNNKEWKQIENLIDNQSILKYLKTESIKRTLAKETKTVSNEDNIVISLEKIKEKYFNKYIGKVIYIDFYATWCGPCIEEIPYAKQMYKEFENKNVVFLNLCAKSKLEDWRNFKKKHELGGENYLLTDEEYFILTNEYKVKGFPTYILLDKKGNVSEYNTLRPSSKINIYEKIDNLILKE